MVDCKHKDAKSTDDADSGVHVTVCVECHAVTHICFAPLPEDYEKALEKIREWGVYHAKAGKGPAVQSALMDQMEETIGDVRKGLHQGRIDKNVTVEAVAAFLEEQGQAAAAKIARNLKLEKTVGCEEEKSPS